MTSWLRKYCNLPLHLVLSCVVLVAAIEASRPGDSVCSAAGVSSCKECLQLSPQCAWCFKEGFLDGAGPSKRCDLPVNLVRRGCGAEHLEQPEVRVEVDATESSTQVTPRDISLTLSPGSEASFIVAVQQLERYPVDLYYLVDVSASMQENLDQLKTVGTALSLRMREHSSDLRLGFGSFVDKPVSPYISVHPSKLQNPCSDYETRCRPAHGYHHLLSLTENTTEFTGMVKRQRISGNVDTPEGGLDAMLQATVCQREVGWRPEAKRLLLLMTDQPSHLALDSRLAGIVTPHDGRCHLENNIYTESTRMDHPSLGQLAEKLLENHVYSIFAVEKKQLQWYEELVALLPGSYLGRLLFQAPPLIELVVNAYKRLLSEVEVEVWVEDRSISRFSVSVSPLCPEGSSSRDDYSCSGVQPNQTVYFNITLGLLSCPDDEDDRVVMVTVRPVGYNESTAVRVRTHCRCLCGSSGRCHDAAEQPPCRSRPGTPTEEAGQANGEQSTDAEPDSGSNMDGASDSGPGPVWSCRAEGSALDCSGRGVCECGRCVCEQSSLGSVYGKHCERDDFSCPYADGLPCAGKGVCVTGECVCEEGWAGESCGCPVSAATCQSDNGLICSGRGRCVCGRCVCDDPQQYGAFCERCPTCHNTCQSYWRCVDCHLSHGKTQEEAGPCNHTCAPLVGAVDQTSGVAHGMWRQCVYTRSSDNCRYRFQTSLASGRTQLHISTHPECVSGGREVTMFLSVCALTVLCGLVVVAVSRLAMQRRTPVPPAGDTEEGYVSTEKDLSYIPKTSEKTVTYRRDCPVEMHIQVPKMALDDPWM
ncbi:integrin beta-8 [Aplochiton taeniatus]